MSRILYSLLLAITLFITCPVSAFASQVTIELENGVSDVFKKDAFLAVEKTEAFFANELQLTLDHPVRIVIVPTTEAYIQAQIRENKTTPELAAQIARTTRAVSNRGIIIQNAGNKSLAIQNERILDISHELVHQYQTQVSGNKHGLLRWMSEGAATVISLRILKQSDNQVANQQKQQAIITKIQKAKSYPLLSTLHKKEQWFSSLDTHGSGLTYSIAEIAVYKLMYTASYKDLFTYFTLTKTKDPATAFNTAFGLPLSTFENTFDAQLAAKLGK